MNKALSIVLHLVVVWLAGCAVGYQARGSLSDVPGEMRGKGYPANVVGGGRFVLADRDRRLQCDGQMLPPENSPVPGSCEGENGKGVVRCSDGREMPVRWTAITCRSFRGGGEDGRGNRLEFLVERGK